MPPEKLGLSEHEVKKGIKKYGYNELKEKKRITPLKILSRQFTNLLIWILFAAAIISAFIGQMINFWVISFIIGFVVILGFIQEYKAERAMEALKKMVHPTTKVVRDGRIRKILTTEVVPDDVLLLETGDKIPADAKIFEIIGLKVDEAALTGESIAIEKSKGELIFAGTQIVHGKCKATVVTTGMETKLGKIAEMIQEREEKTPLQVKMTQLGKILALIALMSCLIIFGLGIFKGASLAEILIIALALAVASVPEGLPLTLTLTLSFAVHRMAKHNAIIRKMLAVETLGSTTVICTDKTGTLTKNEMTVKEIFVSDNVISVGGVGYEPKGSFFVNNKKIDPKSCKELILLLKIATLCNNAVLGGKKGKLEVIGDPTEIALVIAAAKADLWKDDLERVSPRLEEIMFTSERKMMSTLHKKGKEKIVFTKGAPEIILKKCKYLQKNGSIIKLDKKEMRNILTINKDFTSDALRVLGITYKKVSKPLTSENIEKDLVFLGLVAMIDPPREDVKEAIETCKRAKIRVVMVTGDNSETAKAIAKRVGLFEEDVTKKFGKLSPKLRRIVEDGVITGDELNKLSEKEFESLVEGVTVYARTLPEHKLRIIKALKKKGHIVAMTGDGVNDAPAIKKADIGIAMGIKGTDVTREASDMVLQDDNFSTIVEAVKGGRTTYENIEKFTCYLLSRNFTEVILISLGIILLGFKFLPLLALQILFINIFSEEIPAIALGMEPASKGIMRKRPRKSKQGILTKKNSFLVFSLAVFMVIMAFAVFITANPSVNIERARTMTFAAIIGMVILNTFNFRSLDEFISKLGFLTNKWLILGVVSTILMTFGVMYIPFLQETFELTTLGLTDWMVCGSAAFSTFIFAEVIKLVNRKMPANYQ